MSGLKSEGLKHFENELKKLHRKSRIASLHTQIIILF